MGLTGVDVSHHNGEINWNTAAQQIDFAILKLGNTGDNKKFWLDDSFERNYNECKRLNIPVGVYLYCYTNKVENIIQAANEVVNYLKNKSLELPVYLDMEDDEIKVEGKDKLTELVFEFNKVIENAGFWAGVYANKYWFDTFLHNDQIKARFTTWIAHYGINTNKYDGIYDILQYSETGNISGIGKVDMNIMYRDLISEIKGSNNSSNSENTPQKSIDELAREIIDNKWGDKNSNPTRRERLESAGYNYNEVQKRVNEILLADEYYPACDKNEDSIVDGLNSIGVDSSMNNRKKIAQKNNVHDYSGTSTQNNQLLAKLKAGKLKKV